MDLCKKNGLLLIVKTGPYGPSGYADYGIPSWLISKHPEILSLDRDGSPLGNTRITLLHPVFLKFIRLWYAQIAEIVRENSVTRRGGIIVLMQLCSNASFFGSHGAEADYNPAATERYKKFLSEKYKKIARVNEAYKTKYKNFNEIMPPAGDPSKFTELAAEIDYHLFWRNYRAAYVRYIKTEAVSCKIDIPFIYEIPAWKSGRADDYPLNLTACGEAAGLPGKITLSAGHFPENVTSRNFNDIAIVQQLTRAIQGEKNGPFISEIQAGMPVQNDAVYTDEMELLYKTSIASGSAGMNFYMFSQGINPKNKAFNGTTYYWNTPLTYEGKETPLYSTIRRTGKFTASFGDLLSRAKVKSSVALLFYRPYFYTELIRSWNLKKSGLSFNPAMFTKKAFFDGFAASLRKLNCDYDILDLQLCKPSNLTGYKQAWIVSLEYMDNASQQTLAQYVSNGGRLVMMPRLPRFDLSLTPCETLRQALKLEESKDIFLRVPEAEFLEIKGIPVLNPVRIFYGSDTRHAAVLDGGDVCGILKKKGNGSVLAFGTVFENSAADGLEAYSRILKMDNVRGNASCENRKIFLQELFGEDYAFIFAANPYRSDEKVSIIFTDPVTGREIKQPTGGEIILPGLSGLLIPVNVPIRDSGGRIVFSTSQVLDAFGKGESLYIELYGTPYSAGEIVVALKNKPKEVFIDGKRIDFLFRRNSAAVKFKHGDEGSALLKLNLR